MWQMFNRRSSSKDIPGGRRGSERKDRKGSNAGQAPAPEPVPVDPKSIPRGLRMILDELRESQVPNVAAYVAQLSLKFKKLDEEYGKADEKLMS